MIKIGGRGANSSKGAGANIKLSSSMIGNVLQDKVDQLKKSFDSDGGTKAFKKLTEAQEQRDKFNQVKKKIENNAYIRNTKYSIEKNGDIKINYDFHIGKDITHTTATIDGKGLVSYSRKK